MLRRTHFIALALMTLLTMVILNLPNPAKSRLKLGIGSLFLPLFGLAGFSHQLLAGAEDSLTPRRELLKENEQLRRENQQLRLLTKETEEVRRENERLRKSVAWQQRQPWSLKAANVVLREPANWWRTIQ